MPAEMRKMNPTFLNGVPELLAIQLASRREMRGCQLVKAVQTERRIRLLPFMKRIIQIKLLAISLLAVGSSGFAAEGKTATVDFHKVVASYYKTIQAGIVHSNNIVESDKKLNAMIEDLKKRAEDKTRAVDKANDQAISPDERAKSKNEAAEIDLELQFRKEAITNFVNTTETKLEDEWSQRLQGIKTEILGVMDALAKKQGCHLVVNRTAPTMTGDPLVLYTNGEDDLTDSLIKELNSTAPAAPPPETNHPAGAPRLPASSASSPPAMPAPR